MNMADTPLPMVAVNLPAELVAKMEELRQDREDDRRQSVEQIIQRLCRDYVTVREKARWESAHMDELNQSYEQDPSDWDDGKVWKGAKKRAQEKRK
jgi:hypothetical protein